MFRCIWHENFYKKSAFLILQKAGVAKIYTFYESKSIYLKCIWYSFKLNEMKLAFMKVLLNS